MMWGPIASIGISSTPLGFAFVYGSERPGTSVNSDRWHPFQAVEHHNPIKIRLQFPPTIPNGPIALPIARESVPEAVNEGRALLFSLASSRASVTRRHALIDLSFSWVNSS